MWEKNILICGKNFFETIILLKSNFGFEEQNISKKTDKNSIKK